MVSQLILIIGIVCAGLVSAKPPCEASENLKRKENSAAVVERSFDYGSFRDCLRCLNTELFTKKHGYMKQQKRKSNHPTEFCSTALSSFEDQEICNNVFATIGINASLYDIPAYKICERIGLCFLFRESAESHHPKNYKKQTRHKGYKIIIPNDPSDVHDDELPCSCDKCTKCNFNGANDNTGNGQDASNTDSTNDATTTSPCEDCEIIMTMVRKWADDEKYKKNVKRILPLSCHEFIGPLRDRCRELIKTTGPLISMLVKKKSPQTICAVLKECEANVYCSACEVMVRSFKKGSSVASTLKQR